MKKYILLISLCIFSLCTIHAEITWTLSGDGTLTISGTDMPDYKYDDYWEVTDVPWYSQRDKIKKVIIRNGVKNIGNRAFEECKSLTSVNIPNSVTNIGDGAFYKCSGLTSISIPNSVTNIGGSAFAYCKGLTSVTIPNSVTNIGDWAFYKCSGLTSISIPNSVTSIGGMAFYDTKWYDNQPIGLVYAGLVLYRNKNYKNAIIVIKEGTKGIAGGAFKETHGFTSVIIPNSVTNIGDEAFYGCFDLTSITIPNSVTDIGRCAFSGCVHLSSVTLGNSVTKIEEGVFHQCERLKSINIPNSVTTIGEKAFYGCKRLASVTIPESVTTIGKYAFRECTYLSSITIFATIPPNFTPRADSFDNKFPYSYGTLHVLPGYKAIYEHAEIWHFFTIVEDATTGINDVYGSATNSADKIFSTSGQRLNKVGKGVNIFNGKKVLSK